MVQNEPGYVYLLCFALSPYKHAKHYRGWAKSVSARLAEHQAGHGARLTQVLKEHGKRFELSRVWVNKTRHFERTLKQRSGSRSCTICRLLKEVIPVHKDWRNDAACGPGSGVDPEIFFSLGETWRGQDPGPAKAVCWACPVAAECLTSALAAGDDYSIAGGMTPDERRELRVRELVA
jgi:predicted GIY-YIG superfamily endonuclease